MQGSFASLRMTFAKLCMEIPGQHTRSRLKIKRADDPDPEKYFLEMNRELLGDLRILSEVHKLGVPDVRGLDLPCMVDPQLPSLFGGQPLSRVADKILYSP